MEKLNQQEARLPRDRRNQSLQSSTEPNEMILKPRGCGLVRLFEIICPSRFEFSSVHFVARREIHRVKMAAGETEI